MTTSRASAAVELPELPAASFYEQVDETTFASTPATESPWHPQAQHGGPPSALLGRCIEAGVGDEPMAVGKVGVGFLGPIPPGVCQIEVPVLRPGRRVRQVQAAMLADGRAVVTARAWLVSYEDDRAPRTHSAPAPSVLPEPQRQVSMPGVRDEWGYGRAVEWRFTQGGFGAPASEGDDGRTRVWGRTRIPLVAGEETTGLQRLLTLADSTNGVSSRLAGRDWLFVPPAMGVTLQRVPSSEWMHLDAVTDIESRGTGVAHAVVSDAEGLCGYVSQPLLVAPRG